VVIFFYILVHVFQFTTTADEIVTNLIHEILKKVWSRINPSNPELNPICYLLALLGAHHFLHVNRIRVK